MNVVVLTGAGISAESGLRTFRAEDGLWEDHAVEDVATPEGFQRDPLLVQRFYNARRAQLHDPAVQPNAAHLALVELERKASQFLLVTQNVDNLHEVAGSQALIHMHGELFQVCCQSCQASWHFEGDLEVDSVCPHCQQKGSVRPDIVWFGEMPKHMEKIYHALANCDLFIAIGTSGHVYPAAGFVEQARIAGAHTVELNLEPSKTNHLFNEHHTGPASKVVPQFVMQLDH